MGSHKSIRGSSYPTPAPTPPTPVASYNVKGTLTPDATCNYENFGIYNGQPYYRRFDGLWFIWYFPIFPSYIISAALGEHVGSRWVKDAPNIEGDYNPFAGAVGTATVSAGAH